MTGYLCCKDGWEMLLARHVAMIRTVTNEERKKPSNMQLVILQKFKLGQIICYLLPLWDHSNKKYLELKPSLF